MNPFSVRSISFLGMSALPFPFDFLFSAARAFQQPLGPRCGSSSQPGNRRHGWGLAPRHDKRPPRVAVTSPLTEFLTHCTSIRERLSPDVFTSGGFEPPRLSAYLKYPCFITTDRTSKLIFICAHECVCFALRSNATRVGLGESVGSGVVEFSRRNRGLRHPAFYFVSFALRAP